ncbi:glutathione peroxidase [Pontivivens ytuae]|uniref:Glutathione peroxidase n=1 Tax=Pontivivens ytuae TaxID=2789856 RepID=A0A7S9QD24_9RHOB|nr:glutathione peroxidase [Pontivivens ytuae]QPH53706.1 glutathione peroxidase [Pontivivens ytuae]
MKPLVLILALAAAPAAADGAHDFTFDALEGGTLDLSDFAGQTLVVANTASFCAFTPQYEALQALHESDPNVTVIGLPTDDFGGQEYDSADEVAEFCDVNFGITFPMSDIVTTRGPQAHPFFAWARAEGGARALPRWNFHKWVITPEGDLAAALPSSAVPDGPQMQAAIAAAR